MMTSLSLADVFPHTGGELQGDATFNRVSTDTRCLQAGDLYVALQGDNFDGNQFVTAAANAGAAAAVVSTGIDSAIPAIKVADTRLALGMIARTNRRQFKAPVIALTGSAGKTSSKEMIASILACNAKVLATKGNLNNEIGVPITLLEINHSHQFAVIEMGASHAGDIAYLCQFVEPDIALLTNAMPAHIEGFGDIDTIAKTKGEIFSGLSSTATAVINFDDHYYAQWCQQAASALVVSFSKSNAEADFYATDIKQSTSGSCDFILHSKQGGLPISLPLLGEHNVANAVAAAAAASAAGASLQQIKQGLEKLSAVSGRLKVERCGDKTLIDDSYNASPGSVMAAIDVLSGFAGQRCLVLGTMGELAEQAEQHHQQVAAYARDKGIEQFVAVGDYAALMCAEFGGQSKAYTKIEPLLTEYDQLINASVVLIKGSRSARMERLLVAMRTDSERGQ
jgi:UDP-N-acetylmuramoyl-tripeptide--D-alanyl-D-alanine ligase